MNIPTLVIGIAALLFGIYTIYVCSTNPDKFEKLKAMKENFGEKRGALRVRDVHYFISLQGA